MLLAALMTTERLLLVPATVADQPIGAAGAFAVAGSFVPKADVGTGLASFLKAAARRRVRRHVAVGRHGLVAGTWRSEPPPGHAAPPLRDRLKAKLGVTELLPLALAP